jgi:hypothetical protein
MAKSPDFRTRILLPVRANGLIKGCCHHPVRADLLVEGDRLQIVLRTRFRSRPQGLVRILNTCKRIFQWF